MRSASGDRVSSFELVPRIAVELVLMLSIGVLLALLVAGPAARAPRR